MLTSKYYVQTRGDVEFVSKVADAGYTWNEITTLVMNRLDCNEFVEALRSS